MPLPVSVLFVCLDHPVVLMLAYFFFKAPFPYGWRGKAARSKSRPGVKRREENSMEENATNAVNESAQAANAGQEGVQGTNGANDKRFTQEEVNGFIQSRLGRMKDQAAKEIKAEYDKKFADLQAREIRLLVREQLSIRGMSADLADVITCTDENDLKAKLDKLQQIYGSSKKEVKQEAGFIQVGTAKGPDQPTSSDPVRAAMGLNY